MKRTKLQRLLTIFLAILTTLAIACKQDDTAKLTQSTNNIKNNTSIEVPSIAWVEELATTDDMGNLAYTTKQSPPAPVRFIFDYQEEGGSAQSLDAESAIPEELVAITPALSGSWIWVGENSIDFYPDNDWSADTEYKVTFDKTLFNPEYQLKSYTHKFKTAPLAAEFREFKLYKSPVGEDGAVGSPYAALTVYLTFPVDQESFKKGFSITQAGATLDYDVTFDKYNRLAYIKTAAIPIGDKPSALKATLPSATSGGAKLLEAISNSIDVPAASDFFKVNGVTSSIIRNKDEVPEQFVVFDLTLPVAASKLKEGVVIFKLPRAFNGERNYNWLNRNEPITRDILDNLTTLNFEFSDNSASVNVQGGKIFVAPTENIQLGVYIRKGLRSQNGYELAEDFFRVVNVPEFPIELKFTQSGGILSISGDQSLNFMSRNVAKAKIEVSKIIPDRLNHLISQTGGDIDRAEFINYNFSENDISTTYSKENTLANADPSKVNYFTFDLSPYMEGSVGVFVVKIYYMTKGGYYQHSERRLIRVTDTGILMKTNQDDSREIFLLSVRTGRPISGAAVSYLARNGRTVNTVYTNSLGAVKLPKPYTNTKAEDSPIAVTVNNSGDFSFLPFAKYGALVEYNRFDVGGDYTYGSGYAQNYMSLKSYLFTDRGLYRPGDLVHIGVIAKQGDWRSLAGIPMEMVVRDPNGQEVLKHRVTLDDSGLYEMEYQTAYSSPTGIYNMNVSVINDSQERWEYNQLGATSFRVEEFKPDTMKINAYIDGATSKGWLPMDNLTLNVVLTNLYGNPAQNRTVKWHYQLTPTLFSFDEYDDYIFTDPYIDKRAVRNIQPVYLPDGSTDDSGSATIKLDLSTYAGGLYTLIASAEGFEDGSGDSVSTVITKQLSPMRYLVGFKDSDLGYIKRDEVTTAEFIAINPNLERISLDDLKYTITESKFIPILVRQSNGAYGFQSVPKEEVVAAGKFSISADGSTFTLPTDTAGNFQLSLTDDNGNLLARLGYFVAGDSNLTLSLEKEAVLDVKLDKREYAAGEEIEVNIVTPYAGAGLITIERERVYSYKWFRTDTTSTRQTITVPEGLEGNGYLNVSFVRSPDSKEVFVTPYSYGVAPFNVDRAAHETAIAIDVPKEARPGEPLNIGYTASRAGKIIVYAVDEGILQVAGYRTPDPIAAFMRKRALQVATYQTLNLLLSDAQAIREAAGIGGGMIAPDAAYADAMMKMNVNPFKRKVEAPIVFWSGILDAKAGEKASTTFDVPPYFNGALRVMAVAVNATAAGSNEASVLIKAPIIVQPNMPISLIPGDQVGVSVSVANNIEGSGEASVTVAIESDDYFTIVGERNKTITLKEGSEGRVDFVVQANQRLGSGTISVVATSDKYSGNPIKIDATASIHPATLYQSKLTVGMSDRKDVEIKEFSREMYREFAGRSVTASHNPLLIARGLSEYLDEYPFNCTEQIVSRLFPSIYLKEQKEVQAQHAELLNSLRARQISNGGFLMWQGGRSVVNSYATVYTLHYLTDAKSKGYYVPADIMDRGLRYLQSFIAGKVSNIDDATLKAYAAYVLTRNGVVTTAFITDLDDYFAKSNDNAWRSHLVSVYMASIYKMLQMDTRASELIRGYKPEVKAFTFYSDFDSSSLRNTVYLYLLSQHFSDMVSKVDIEIVQNLMDSIAKGHYNSLLSAYSMISLASLADLTTDDGIKILLDGVESNITMDPYPVATYTGAIQSATATAPNEGAMGFYLVASESGYDLNMPDKVAEGIEIERAYLDRDGNVKSAFSQGDDVTVRVRVRTNGSMPNIASAAIIDLLPGAFELQVNSIDELRRDSSVDNVDVREDRIILYAPLSGSVSEFVYRAKVVSRGEFTVPPAYAQAIYDPVYRGNTSGGRIVVGEVNE
ncbi:MAG: alpha-2-macroglobulin family protein [Deferribacteraceae bacterium]|nr:alpha-2-macroglobulin family protein [Deferribacteraceae bacterium]